MNAADKEIIGIEDTLYKLKLLVGATETAEEEKTNLTEVISSSSDILKKYDITSYATDPLHETKIANILNSMGDMKDIADIDAYIALKSEGSPLTGQMILDSAKIHDVDISLMMAIMELDSHFGTLGKAVSTKNPGNVGNDDDGNIRTYDSWQEGVTAVSDWLNDHRIVNELFNLDNIIAPTSTTTPSTIDTSTTTPSTATSTPSTVDTATTTPSTIDVPTASTTPSIVDTATTATTTPSTATSTPSTIDTSTTTPSIATSTPSTVDTSTTSGTPSTASSTPSASDAPTTTSELVPPVTDPAPESTSPPEVTI
jgi:hypothetical protein